MLGSRASTQGKKNPATPQLMGGAPYWRGAHTETRSSWECFPGEMRSMQTYRVEGNEENFLKYFK